MNERKKVLVVEDTKMLRMSLEVILQENYEVFLEAVKKAKPSGVKGAYIKQIVLCSTMGPGVKIMV